jgi:hypothetical protein
MALTGTAVDSDPDGVIDKHGTGPGGESYPPSHSETEWP